eukprot:376671-Amphidinium_carterae.1
MTNPFLKVDRQKVYFEVEVMELESGRSQTLALGVCSSLPPARPVLLERAKDLGEGKAPFQSISDYHFLYMNKCMNKRTHTV